MKTGNTYIFNVISLLLLLKSADLLSHLNSFISGFSDGLGGGQK